jgi:hypothetical protein
MDPWLYQPLLVASAIEAKSGDLEPVVWPSLVRALRLVIAGEASVPRHQAGMWSKALEMLAEARSFLPCDVVDPGPEAEPQWTSRQPENATLDEPEDDSLQLAVHQRAAGLSEMMQARGTLLSVELARLVDALADSLVAALRSVLRERRVVLASAVRI